MNARPVWMHIETYRACDLCKHVQAGPERLCGCPDAMVGGKPLPVHQVRALGGDCGPDADHMVMTGWER